MTTGELIRDLRTMPQDQDVAVADADGNFYNVSHAEPARDNENDACVRIVVLWSE